VKRLNPKTGKPFKLGEMGHPFKFRETKEVTRMFKSYQKVLNKHGFFNETWVTQKEYEEYKIKQNKKAYKKLETEEGHLKLYLNNSKTRAKKYGLDFNLDIEHIKSIQTDKCPVFGTPFVWGLSRRGNSSTAATVDRIVPELGYVKGNVAFISDLANRIKTDATEVQIYAVADWLNRKRKEVLNAFKKAASSVPAGNHRKGKINPKHGIIPTTGSGEDSDNPNNHKRTIPREDGDRRPKARGGDSVGRGDKKVGAPQAPQSKQDHGQPDSKIISLELRRADLFNKP
jgi:hypothetical protein